LTPPFCPRLAYPNLLLPSQASQDAHSIVTFKSRKLETRIRLHDLPKSSPTCLPRSHHVIISSISIHPAAQIPILTSNCKPSKTPRFFQNIFDLILYHYHCYSYFYPYCTHTPRQHTNNYLAQPKTHARFASLRLLPFKTLYQKAPLLHRKTIPLINILSRLYLLRSTCGFGLSLHQLSIQLRELLSGPDILRIFCCWLSLGLFR
jgi:hypothetical protein